MRNPSDDRDSSTGVSGRKKLPVSLCITNFNGAAYLPWCLDAVQRLDPGPSEILLVDNASTDDSVSIVRENHPTVTVLTLPENHGPCPARNLGLRKARHSLVFQIDSDVAPRADCLGKLSSALEAAGDCTVACQPRGIFHDQPDTIHYDGARFHYVGLMTLLNHHARLSQCDRETDPREVDAVISLALLLKKEALLDIGGYDPNFFVLFEDHDLSYRLRLKDLKLAVAPEALVDHREGTPGVSFRGADYPAKRIFLHSRNRWIVLARNHRFRTLLLSLPALLLYEITAAAFSLRQGFPLEYIKGKLSFLRMFPRLLAERRMIQAGRVLRDKDLLKACDLTFSPLIRRSGLESFLVKCLNGSLRFWWRLVKPWIG